MRSIYSKGIFVAIIIAILEMKLLDYKYLLCFLELTPSFIKFPASLYRHLRTSLLIIFLKTFDMLGD